MDYRFTMTPRLIAITVVSFLLLLVLLFALGFVFGQQWGADDADARHRAAGRPSDPIGLSMNQPGFSLPSTPASPTAPREPATTPPPSGTAGALPAKGASNLATSPR